jgi:hypothetical protein
MAYIGILVPQDLAPEQLDAYRYGMVMPLPIDEPSFNERLRIRVWVCSSFTVAQNQADRLGSGLIGARAVLSEVGLDAWLKEVWPEHGNPAWEYLTRAAV